MKTLLRSAASVLAMASVLAAPVPALAFGAGVAAPWDAPAAPEAPGVLDKLRGLVKGGLISMAVAFTNIGADIVVDRILQSQTAPKNIGWGVGTNAAAVGDTALQTESAPTTAGGRTVGTESQATTTVTGDTYQVVGTVTAGSTLAITEAGTFDAVTAGRMLLRGVFSAVNVVSGDSIAFTFGLTFVPSVT